MYTDLASLSLLPEYSNFEACGPAFLLLLLFSLNKTYMFVYTNEILEKGERWKVSLVDLMSNCPILLCCILGIIKIIRGYAMISCILVLKKCNHIVHTHASFLYFRYF